MSTWFQDLGFQPSSYMERAAQRFDHPLAAWTSPSPDAALTWALAAHACANQNERRQVLRTALGFVQDRQHYLRLEQLALRSIVLEIERWLEGNDACDFETLITRHHDVSQMWDTFDWEPLYDEREELLAAQRAETVDKSILILVFASKAFAAASGDPRALREFASELGGLADTWVNVEGNPFVDSDEEVETWKRLGREISAVMTEALPFVKDRLAAWKPGR